MRNPFGMMRRRAMPGNNDSNLVAPPPKQIQAFKTDDELLESAVLMLRARQAMREPYESEGAARKDREARHRAWQKYWHGAFKKTRKQTTLTRRCAEAELNEVERELLIILILERLALWDLHRSSCRELLELIDLPERSRLAALRGLSETGRLLKTGLLVHGDADDELADRTLIVDPGLVELTLTGERRVGEAWPCRTEPELYARLGGLGQAFERRADILEHMERGYGPDTHHLLRENRRIELTLKSFAATLKLHPQWKLGALLREAASPQMQQFGLDTSFEHLDASQLILLMLLCRELGHLRQEEATRGVALAMAVSERPNSALDLLPLLQSDSLLVERGLAQACAGAGTHVSAEPSGIAEVEFELGPRALEILDLDRKLTRRNGRFEMRDPRVKLEDLVLDKEPRKALELALAQARHSQVLLERWGLASVIPYGRGLAMLFYGPPGTGKTACAEAVAHALGRPLLVASYAELQNAFVGQTEKNVARIFRQASAANAVLLFDEADAIFFDRDTAQYNWESREVNVLLQEIERHEGVCILTTNRRPTLDKALARRLALKLGFERPDFEARKRIWTLLRPAKLPLAKGIDIDALAHHELSGGEIKNVLLNAARSALRRGPRSRITQKDFDQAIALEKSGAWGEDGPRDRLGF
jgi:AAA+ superfamily predicted ATPase